MKARPWCGPLLGLIVICLAPSSVTRPDDGGGEPWPALLSNTRSGDLQVAALQDRAHAALERLLEARATAD